MPKRTLRQRWAAVPARKRRIALVGGLGLAAGLAYWLVRRQQHKKTFEEIQQRIGRSLAQEARRRTSPARVRAASARIGHRVREEDLYRRARYASEGLLDMAARKRGEQAAAQGQTIKVL